jgi:hypothetical protein
MVSAFESVPRMALWVILLTSCQLQEPERGAKAFLPTSRITAPKSRASTRCRSRGGDVRCVSLVAYYREGISFPVEERPAAHFVEERAPSPVQQ